MTRAAEGASGAGDVFPQVSPLRVRGLDQLDLPGALPGLQELLAPDGVLARVVMLGEDEAAEPVLAANGGALAGAVPGDARGMVGGDADVEDAADVVGHDVGPAAA